jgi:hypothetical protein
VTDPWGAHQEAVRAAIGAIGEVQGALHTAHSNAETAIGLIAQATGGELCPAESGRNAFGFGAGLPEHIQEVLRRTFQIVSELERYQSGF